MSDIVVEVRDSVGSVRLNRPDRGNSVTPDVITRLGEAVRDLAEQDAVRAVVLTGTGKVFCAGADVKEMYAVYQDTGADGLMQYQEDVWMPSVQRTVRTLWSVRKPLVAAFNGAATAGGLDFGLSCDVRVAANTARFAESYVNLGMVPVAGGAFLLPVLIGLGPATELLATGRFIDAERAYALGMVNEVCEPEQVTERAHDLAAGLAGGSSETFAHTKQIARNAVAEQFDLALRESYQANIELMKRDEVRERIVAVMERYSLKHAKSS